VKVVVDPGEAAKIFSSAVAAATAALGGNSKGGKK
jgi:hypothetical protein